MYIRQQYYRQPKSHRQMRVDTCVFLHKLTHFEEAIIINRRWKYEFASDFRILFIARNHWQIDFIPIGSIQFFDASNEYFCCKTDAQNSRVPSHAL